MSSGEGEGILQISLGCKVLCLSVNQVRGCFWGSWPEWSCPIRESSDQKLPLLLSLKKQAGMSSVAARTLIFPITMWAWKQTLSLRWVCSHPYHYYHHYHYCSLRHLKENPTKQWSHSWPLKTDNKMGIVWSHSVCDYVLSSNRKAKNKMSQNHWHKDVIKWIKVRSRNISFQNVY